MPLRTRRRLECAREAEPGSFHPGSLRLGKFCRESQVSARGHTSGVLGRRGRGDADTEVGAWLAQNWVWPTRCFSVDEKSGIDSGSESHQPSLSFKPGRGSTMPHDYKRKGTTTLRRAGHLDWHVHLQVHAMTSQRRALEVPAPDRSQHRDRKEDPYHRRQLRHSDPNHENVRAWLEKILVSPCTSPRPAPVGSTSWSAGSGSSPTRRSAEAALPESRI